MVSKMKIGAGQNATISIGSSTMNMPRWSEDEIRILTASYKYPSDLDRLRTLLPNHPRLGIRAKIYSLGLNKKRYLPFSDEDTKLICKEYGKDTYEFLHNLLPNHSINSIKHHCYKIGLRRDLTPKKIKVICKMCNKEIHIWPRDYRNGKYHFCSKACYHGWRAILGPAFYGYYPNIELKRLSLRCFFCGKEFMNYPSNLLNDKHHFCSLSCVSKYYRSVRRIEPTSIEKRFMEIVDKYNLPFKFVGDGKIWIANNNPDFIHTDRNRKLVVEIYGSYFHNPIINPRIKKIARADVRTREFKRHGWDCIIIWDYELQSEQLVLKRLGVTAKIVRAEKP